MDRTLLGWQVQNLSDTEADVDIFDVIGLPEDWGGTSAKAFVQELRALDVARINLHVNSPGGYVDDALAMYTAIQQHPAEVVAYVESIAASAASFLVMAADKVVIAKTGKMMIHDAHGWGMGNAADLRELADYLDEESANIASIYADKAGGTAEDWRAAMLANNRGGTWYRGQAAVDAGLADEVMSAPARKNVQPMRAAAYLHARNADRTMSQGNLDKMHGAIESLEAVHEAVCDMGDSCPMDEGMSDKLAAPPIQNSDPQPAFIDSEVLREAFAILKQ